MSDKLRLKEQDEGIVFAGIGEPLLRLGDVLEATALIKEARHGVPIRINTTGTGISNAEKTVQHMLEAGIDTASVFIPSAIPKQYEQIMNAKFSVPCTFLSMCSDAGLATRVVTVSNSNVDVKAIRMLSEALGAVEFEVKDYVA